LLGVVVTFWVFYHIAVFLFNRGVFNIFIKKSCKVRDERQAKKRVRFAERQRQITLAKAKRDKYYKEHKEEIDAKNKKRTETAKKWFSTIGKVVKPVIWFLGGIIKVIVGIVMIIWWFIKKIGEIIYVIWHMVTTTFSNHCPPIEFIESCEDVGELIPNRHNGGYLDGEKRRLHINADEFPEKFRLRTKQADYKKVRIAYTLVTSESSDYDNRYHVHSITSIKYLPKPRKSRAKMKKDGE